jgi:hypothetical protein
MDPGPARRVNFRRAEAAKQSAADWQGPIRYGPVRRGVLVYG